MILNSIQTARRSSLHVMWENKEHASGAGVGANGRGRTVCSFRGKGPLSTVHFFRGEIQKDLRLRSTNT